MFIYKYCNKNIMCYKCEHRRCNDIGTFQLEWVPHKWRNDWTNECWYTLGLHTNTPNHKASFPRQPVARTSSVSLCARPAVYQLSDRPIYATYLLLVGKGWSPITHSLGGWILHHQLYTYLILQVQAASISRCTFVHIYTYHICKLREVYQVGYHRNVYLVIK